MVIVVNKLIKLLLMACVLLTTFVSADTEVHLRGIVMPAQKVKLSFSQPGIVRELAKGGSMLSQGDLVGKLDDKKAKAQLLQAHAELRSAQSQLAQQEHSRDKNARLVEQNILSDIALTEAEFSVTVAAEKVAVAEAKLQMAKAGVEACTVYAPFDGAVVGVNVSNGEWVKQGDAFIEFVNFSELTLSIDIQPQMADELTLGLTTDVLNGDEVVGRAEVKTIYPVIDPASGLRRIVWHVYPKEGLLLSGRYVSLAPWAGLAGLASNKGNQ